jgi:L-tyrosine peroxygenase
MRNGVPELPTLNRLPDAGTWDYGAGPYGLEPMILPAPGTFGPAEAAEPPVAFAQAMEWIDEDGTITGAVKPCEQPDTLYWFRWITGHQLSFIAWRLAATRLSEVALFRLPANDAIPELSNHIDTYSAMLLYTASCPRELYHRLIRPSMQLHHPAFSGSWAPDFGPVRHLLRGRVTMFEECPRLADLRQAVLRCQLVHEYVASRLVPDGVSLLRSWVPDNHRLDGRLLQLIYDNYFLTNRAPVRRSDVIAQLLRRVVAVLRDLSANGMICESDEDIETLHTAGVIHCEQQIANIVAEFGRRAIVGSQALDRPAYAFMVSSGRHY